MHYPFHPCHGVELSVVKEYQRQEHVCVKLPDSTHAHLPKWMFDFEICVSTRVEATPMISVNSLKRLRELLADWSLEKMKNRETINDPADQPQLSFPAPVGLETLPSQSREEAVQLLIELMLAVGKESHSNSQSHYNNHEDQAR